MELGLVSKFDSILIQIAWFNTDLMHWFLNSDYICFKSALFWCYELLLGINTDF